MRRVFGPRSAVEAVFLVAVPVVSGQVGLGSYAIVAASAIGYLLVLLVEGLLWRKRSTPTSPAVERAYAVTPSSRDPEAASGAGKRELEPEPVPEPEPERILQSVPDLEPEPEPELEPLPAATVHRLDTDAEPRRWNLRDLERATRDGAGEDALRDEERAFLLVYLREFAGPDGLLPVDFDPLVRDSFGELVEAW